MGGTPPGYAAYQEAAHQYMLYGIYPSEYGITSPGSFSLFNAALTSNPYDMSGLEPYDPDNIKYDLDYTHGGDNMLLHDIAYEYLRRLYSYFYPALTTQTLAQHLVTQAIPFYDDNFNDRTVIYTNVANYGKVTRTGMLTNISKFINNCLDANITINNSAIAFGIAMLEREHEADVNKVGSEIETQLALKRPDFVMNYNEAEVRKGAMMSNAMLQAAGVAIELDKLIIGLYRQYYSDLLSHISANVLWALELHKYVNSSLSAISGVSPLPEYKGPLLNLIEGVAPLVTGALGLVGALFAIL